ncbi:MAG: regulatory signaling modulator protein AmpE [Gammaproteobacteria bacterium]
MTLVAILISLLLDRLLGQLPDWRRYRFLASFARWVYELPRPDILHGVFGVLITLFPLLLVITLLQAWLDEGILHVPGLIVATTVLLYCLGPRDLDRDVDGFRTAHNSGDDELIKIAAGHVVAGHVPESEQERNRAVTDAVFAEANERMFAVLFWFSVLGPVGAVLFRSASVLRNSTGTGDWGEYHPAAALLHDILAWVPARLLALCFGLSGHFDGAIHAWRNMDDEEPSGFVHGGAEFLVKIGNGALDLQPNEGVELKEVTVAMGLVWRSIVIWVVVIALLTLAGWAA